MNTSDLRVCPINQLFDHRRSQCHAVVLDFLVIGLVDDEDKKRVGVNGSGELTRIGSRASETEAGTLVPQSFVSLWKEA